MKLKLIPALLATVLPVVAGAQVPGVSVRPSLTVGQAQPLQQVPATGMPSTALVQRNFDASQAQMGLPQQQPASEEFFYVDENSAGPENFANGLSDYNTGMMTQAGAQLGGDYGALGTFGSMPAGVVQDAWNRPFDNMSSGQSAPGTIRYQWTADLIMPVRLRAGMVTSVVLPEWDAVQDVLIGDDAAVEATILRPNQVGVKSVQTGLDTSLSIIGGSGNVYTFYLRTEGRNTKLVSDMQVFVQAAPSKSSGEWFNSEVRSAYGNSGATSAAPDGASAGINVPNAASQGDEPVPSDRREFNLKMFEVNPGDRVIAPEYAYSDGRFTYLHFAPGVTDRPAAFRVVDGVEGRVNTRVTGRYSEVIVVEAVGDFVLRSGTRAVCVVRVDDQDQPVDRRS